MNYKQKPKFNIFSSILRISAGFAMIALSLSMIKLSNTNSFFSDEASIEGSTLVAGYWIPEIQMSIEPKEPDGKKDSYKTTPCVTLSADIHGEKDGVKIFYEFSDDGDPVSGGEEYAGECIEIPDGDPTHFQAQAVNVENYDWKSGVVSKDFKVKTEAEKGDVVINELMWMGRFDDNDDEWIELRNMTDEEIDISGWRILGGGTGSGEKAHIQIPNGYAIEKNGYFLITKKKWDKTEINLSEDLDKNEGMTNVAGMDLKNSGEKLVLEDNNKKNIDTAWKDGLYWPDGWHGIFLHMSMARDEKPGDGDSDSDWHTCICHECNGKDYWRHEGLNFGTPGKKNSSKRNSSDPGSNPEMMERDFVADEDGKEDGINDESKNEEIQDADNSVIQIENPASEEQSGVSEQEVE